MLNANPCAPLHRLSCARVAEPNRPLARTRCHSVSLKELYRGYRCGPSTPSAMAGKARAQLTKLLQRPPVRDAVTVGSHRRVALVAKAASSGAAGQSPRLVGMSHRAPFSYAQVGQRLERQLGIAQHTTNGQEPVPAWAFQVQRRPSAVLRKQLTEARTCQKRFRPLVHIPLPVVPLAVSCQRNPPSPTSPDIRFASSASLPCAMCW